LFADHWPCFAKTRYRYVLEIIFRKKLHVFNVKNFLIIAKKPFFLDRTSSFLCVLLESKKMLMFG